MIIVLYLVNVYIFNMFFLSKAKLFTLLEHHWKEELTLEFVKSLTKKVDDKYLASFEVSDIDLKTLRAELYRLKQSGAKARCRGKINTISSSSPFLVPLFPGIFN